MSSERSRSNQGKLLNGRGWQRFAERRTTKTSRVTNATTTMSFVNRTADTWRRVAEPPLKYAAKAIVMIGKNCRRHMLMLFGVLSISSGRNSKTPGPVSRVFAGKVGADYTPFPVCNFEGPFFG